VGPWLHEHIVGGKTDLILCMLHLHLHLHASQKSWFMGRAAPLVQSLFGPGRQIRKIRFGICAVFRFFRGAGESGGGGARDGFYFQLLADAKVVYYSLH
jgi:hypothetical protein